MKKFMLMLLSIVLTADTAYAQAGSGTVIIIDFSKGKLVVAADSRAVYSKGDKPPDDTQCKLATFDHKTVFATGGTAVRFRKSGDDPVGEWRNVDVARVAVDSVNAATPNLEGDTHTQAIAQKWAELLAEKWATFYLWHQAAVVRAAEDSKGILTYGLFAEAQKGTIYRKFAAIVFTRGKSPPIATSPINLTSCWPCGQGTEVSLCALGHDSVAAGLCSQGNRLIIGKRKRHHITSRGQFDRQEFTAIYAARMTENCDLTNEVGGPIDVLELTAIGDLRWILNSKDCP